MADREVEGRNKAPALRRISQGGYPYTGVGPQAVSQYTGGLETAVQLRGGYQYAAHRKDVVAPKRRLRNRVGKLDWERCKNSFPLVPVLPRGAG